MHLESKEDYELLKKELRDVEYHTYTPKDKRTKAVVIKGISGNVDSEDLLKELKEHNISVISCIEMRDTQIPLYMVVTDASSTLKQLSQQVKYLYYTKITWKRYYNKRKITQCHRCQEWGHATTNCNVKPRCLKCAEEHLTKDCKKTKDTPAKCANCAKNHSANATICEKYQDKLDWITKTAKNTINCPNKTARRTFIDLKDEKAFPRLNKSNRGSPTNYWTTPRNIDPQEEFRNVTEKHNNGDFNNLINE